MLCGLNRNRKSWNALKQDKIDKLWADQLCFGMLRNLLLKNKQLFIKQILVWLIMLGGEVIWQANHLKYQFTKYFPSNNVTERNFKKQARSESEWITWHFPLKTAFCYVSELAILVPHCCFAGPLFRQPIVLPAHCSAHLLWGAPILQTSNCSLPPPFPQDEHERREMAAWMASWLPFICSD